MKLLHLSMLLSQSALAWTLPYSSDTGPDVLLEKRGLAQNALIGSSFGTPENKTFDFVVVGGGVAGLTLAARLSEDPKALVAVIEAGSFYEIDNGNYSQVPAFDTRWTGKDPNDVNPLVDWGFVTAPQKGLYDAKVHYARGKTLGGSSARNYMAYQRGTYGSYDAWAEEAGDDSYRFENFLPYFQKSMNYTAPDSSKRAANATVSIDLDKLGHGGPLRATFSNYANAASSWAQKGFEAIGIHPINGFTDGFLNGSSYVLENIDATAQTRESSETAFLRPALERRNLIVYQSTLGKSIIFDSNKTATGVIASQGQREFILSARKEVIVSAGAFQSPQLLMVSGVGPAETLRALSIPVVADRPGVGQNMWDHILAGPSWRVNAITASSLADPEFADKAVDDYLNRQEGILTNSGGDFLAWEKIPGSARNFSTATESSLAKFPKDWPEVEYLSMSGYLGFQENYARDAPQDHSNYYTVSVALVAPLSRGTVSISSADASDPPIINPNWLTDEADQEVFLAGYKRVREFFATSAMAPLLIGEEAFPGNNRTDAELLNVIKQSVSTVYHAACTCKMGKAEDKMSVVDAKARVIGTQSLRVVDASAFPILPPGHPIATIYALAEKIAADILDSAS